MWNKITIEEYLEIQDKGYLLPDEFIELATQPETIKCDKLTVLEYINMQTLVSDIHMFCEQYKGKSAGFVLGTYLGIVEYLQLLSEQYEFIFKSDEPTTGFAPDKPLSILWLSLCNEVCKEFNICIFDLYNRDVNDFLELCVYLKYKRQDEERQYKNFRK